MPDIRVLVVDDEQSMRDLLAIMLRQAGYDVTVADGGEPAIEALKVESFDLVVTDLRMRKVDGLTVLKAAKEHSPRTVVLVVTAYASTETAVEAMKLGAYDYVTKPFKLDELKVTVANALERRRLQEENLALKRQLHRERGFENFVGRSPKILDVFETIRKTADSGSTVMITGESGTGKELVAQALHWESSRRGGPFVSVNCGAVPEALMESELFGHEKGAFTGAVNAKPGLVDLADGGTLLLDEIGEMEPDSQVKLLRALETGMFFRVGGTRPRSVDIRIVAATNRDLAEAMRAGEFRQDLYYRINTITVSLPPLRERREDIALLAQHFVESKAAYGSKRLSPETLAVLEAYAWPGNVRELLHAIERGVILSKGDEIEPGDLPPEVLGAGAPPTAPGGSLETIERTHIVTTLRQVSGHRGKAAALLGIDPKTLYRKIIGYQIKPEEFR
jgi:DNA-binding NtrC family response regulator